MFIGLLQVNSLLCFFLHASNMFVAFSFRDTSSFFFQEPAEVCGAESVGTLTQVLFLCFDMLSFKLCNRYKYPALLVEIGCSSVLDEVCWSLLTGEVLLPVLDVIKLDSHHNDFSWLYSYWSAQLYLLFLVQHQLVCHGWPHWTNHQLF